MTNINQVKIMPLLALRGLVVFPGMLLHFDVGRKKSIEALNHAMAADQTIFLSSQKDMRVDDPTPDELYDMGCIAHIRQVLKLPGDNIRVLVEGLTRAKKQTVISAEPFYTVEITECNEKKIKEGTVLESALIRNAREAFEEYSEVSARLSPDVVMSVYAMNNAGKLADYITSNIILQAEDKQTILNELNPFKRIEKLIVFLKRESDILSLNKEIHEKVSAQIEQNQREYYLREQIKAINSELSDGDNPAEESEDYRYRIYSLHLEKETEEKLVSEADKLGKMPFGSHESSVIRNYLDTCLALPWNKFTKDKIDLEKARKILDRDHYGLHKVKDRVIELLAVPTLAPKINNQIVCLVGPPGVGKTSVARSIAKCMGRKYVRVSLGGVRDEADIRGHRKTYIGAMCGRIINAIKQSGVSNPLILLDEIDKLSSDFRGDPSSALLEALDGEQNFAFRDHYLEIPYNLSQVLFLTTANTVETIPAPLLDRMEVISLTSYTREEKYHIAKNHLLQKQLKKHGLTAKQLKIADSAVYDLIDCYTREAGVRNLERSIAALCRKTAKKVVIDPTVAVKISDKNIEEYLGVRKYKPETISKADEIAVVNGLAWTQVGGELMQIEAAALDGTGKIVLTGSLGDVMKESAQTAVSFIRSRARELCIDTEFYKNKDVHIHATESAIPKDGPSAGITMALAVISALTGIPIRRDIAMTGEITLRGRVLPIGGLKEKSMAAYKAGVKTVLIPMDNAPDVTEIDETVKNSLQFVPVVHMDEVLKLALVDKPCPKPSINVGAVMQSDVTVDGQIIPQ